MTLLLKVCKQKWPKLSLTVLVPLQLNFLLAR